MKAKDYMYSMFMLSLSSSTYIVLMSWNFKNVVHIQDNALFMFLCMKIATQNVQHHMNVHLNISTGTEQT